MGLLQSNSNSSRQETRRERRQRLYGRRRTTRQPYVPISPWWGITTAFHLWEQIFLTCPWHHREGVSVQSVDESERVYEYDVHRLLAELPRYQYHRYRRMNR
jgi:hypothetical protein